MGEEVQHQAVELIGVLELGPVATLGENVKLRAGNAPQEAKAAIQRRHEVVGTPDD